MARCERSTSNFGRSNLSASNNNITQNFFFVFVSLLVVLVFGGFGYSLIEGLNWVDALYMTFITFSTVGFREVGTLSAPGRIFTMFIILSGLILISMLSASVTSLLVSRELLPSFKTRKMKKQIQQLQGHTILCGAGETGETIITEFITVRKPIVVIEKESEVLEELSELYPNFLIVLGDATKDEILFEANIANASSLITVLSEDADNLFVVISARSINPELNIIARAVDSHTQGKMYRAGADHVISPNITEGLRMAAMVLRPTVVNFLDVLVRDDETANRLEEIIVPSGSSLHGKTLEEAAIPKRTGLIVIAMQKESDGGHRMIYNPQSSAVINQRDRFIVLGKSEGIDKLNKIANG